MAIAKEKNPKILLGLELLQQRIHLHEQTKVSTVEVMKFYLLLITTLFLTLKWKSGLPEQYQIDWRRRS